MSEELRDRQGKLIGTYSEEGGRRVLRDRQGKRLGEFDPASGSTRDAQGRYVGAGDQLGRLLGDHGDGR